MWLGVLVSNLVGTREANSDLLRCRVLELRGLSIAITTVVAACSSPAPTNPTSPAMTNDPKPSLSPAAPPDPAPTTRAVAIGTPIELTDGTSLAVTDIVVETIAPAPDDPAAYPAGSGARVLITVGGDKVALTKLSAGYDASPVAWVRDLKIELHDTDGKVAQLSVHRVSDRVLASESIRIRRGERVRLHDTLDFTFVGHSHKSVMAGMESPLMVNVDYHDGHRYPRTHSLFPPREATWTWQDVRFTLGDYRYGDFMDLVVDRMALDPVMPPRSDAPSGVDGPAGT